MRAWTSYTPYLCHGNCFTTVVRGCLTERLRHWSTVGIIETGTRIVVIWLIRIEVGKWGDGIRILASRV